MRKFLIFILSITTFVNLLYSEYIEELTKYFDGRKILKISVENVNGDIELKRWEKPEIYVFIKKSSRSRSILEKTDIIFEELNGELKIKVKKRDGWRIFGGSIANVEITINTPSPKELYLSTVNGSVEINQMEGTLNVSSVNGKISIISHKGKIKSETVNGSIYLSKIYGTLRGETVNGSINAEFIDIEEYLDLSTVNGSVTLGIENLDNAEVKVETVNGGINIEEFQKPMKKLSLKRRSAYFIVGDGRRKINIETVNGSIKIGSSLKSI